MRRRSTILSLAIVSLLVALQSMPSSGLAAAPPPPAASAPAAAKFMAPIYCGGLPGCTTSGITPFQEYFTRFLAFLLTRLPIYAYLLGVLFVMVGGAYIVLSAGSSERVTKGKNTITWAVVGVFTVYVAEYLVRAVIGPEATDVLTAPGGDLIEQSVNTFASTIFDLLYISILGVAVFCGMWMVVSLGKDEQFGKAREGLFWAAVGAIVINLAHAIVSAVLSL